MCSVGQASTIEHEERYYKRVRHGLQTATQTRLDIQQQPCRSQRSMRHSNSDGLLLLRHELTDLRQISVVDCPSRHELTTSFPYTSMQFDDRVCIVPRLLKILYASFLQRVSIACYAERCISYSKSVRPSVCPSVRHTLALSQNDSSYDHGVFTGG